MKYLLTIAIALSMPEMAIAQRYQGNGQSVSSLGSVTANSSAQASKLCAAKGGNLLVRQYGDRYSCYFAQQISR